MNLKLVTIRAFMPIHHQVTFITRQHRFAKIISRRRRRSRIQSKRDVELSVSGGGGAEGHGEGIAWVDDVRGGGDFHTDDDTEGGMGGKRKEKEDRHKYFVEHGGWSGDLVKVDR